MNTINKSVSQSQAIYNRILEAKKKAVKVVTPKSKRKVARFPLFISTANNPDIPFSGKFKQTIPWAQSFCLAYRFIHTGKKDNPCGGNWISLTGCCAGIADNGYAIKTRYFIPHVDGMSIKKKIAYIEDLKEIIPDIKILGVIPTTDIANHPLEVETTVSKDYKHLPLSDTTFAAIKSQVAHVKEWIVVDFESKERITKSPLLVLQLLRTLYMPVGISSNIADGKITYNLNYLQPRLYFRLKRWFPKLSIYDRLFLSHQLHGQNITGTYHPWFFLAKPSEFKLTRELGEKYDINTMVKISRAAPYDVVTRLPQLKNGKSLKYPDIKLVKYGIDNNSCYLLYLLTNLFLNPSRENYIEAIRFISMKVDYPELYNKVKE